MLFVGKCSDRDFVHVQSAGGASWEGEGKEEGEWDTKWRSGLWLECRTGGSRWLPPLLFSRPTKCCLCQRHRWMGFQVRPPFDSYTRVGLRFVDWELLQKIWSRTKSWFTLCPDLPLSLKNFGACKQNLWPVLDLQWPNTICELFTDVPQENF